MVLDEKVRFWRDPEAEAARMFDTRLWSSANPSHPVIYEVGHAARHKNDPKLYNSLEHRRFTDEELAAISGKVSKYAETDPREFVAEVFAGLADGKAYDEQVVGLYEMFRGFPIGGKRG